MASGFSRTVSVARRSWRPALAGQVLAEVRSPKPEAELYVVHSNSESVLIGQSYYLRFDPKLWSAMRPYPPLGALYAAGVLREAGCAVALFDAMLATSEAEWAAALDRERPRIALIYEDNFNYLTKMCLSRMRDAAFAMLALARSRGCTTIVCGSDATDQADAYLAAGADFVITGEGEATLVELAGRLRGRTTTAFAAIQGLVYRAATAAALGDRSSGDNASIVRTPRRPDITALDALPRPAWDLVDVPRYRSIWTARHGSYSMNLVSTRGCPYHCNWCAKPIWGQRYNVRSPESVVAEIAWLHDTYRPDHIWFADDIFGLTPGWLQRFAELVEAAERRLPFKSLSRADLLLRDGEIAALARAGCEMTWIGAESGSQRVLDAMDKGTRVDQIVEATRRLKAAGIRVGFFLQFGYPGEGRDDIELTLAMVRACMPDDIGISVSYPLPGTPFHDRVQATFGDKRNWIDSNDLDPMYEGPFSREFYRALHTVVHKEFRARKAWRDLGVALRQPAVGNGLSAARLPRWRPLGRQAASMVLNAATLPLARHRLERLAQPKA